MANCSIDEIVPHWKFGHRHSQGVFSALPAAVSSLGLNGSGAAGTFLPPPPPRAADTPSVEQRVAGTTSVMQSVEQRRPRASTLLYLYLQDMNLVHSEPSLNAY